MDVTPSLPELMQHANVGIHWYDVGIQLHIEVNKLDEIQQLHDNKLSKMYQLWLDTNPQATRKQLIDVLSLPCICQNAVAVRYKTWLQSTNTSCNGHQHEQQQSTLSEAAGGVTGASTEEVDCVGVASVANGRANGNIQHEQAGQNLDITKLYEVLKYLRERYNFNKRKWRDLGLSLGIYPNTLDTIEEDFPRNTHRCLQECLSKWLRGVDGARAKGINWDTLNDAIESIEQ